LQRATTRCWLTQIADATARLILQREALRETRARLLLLLLSLRHVLFTLIYS